MCRIDEEAYLFLRYFPLLAQDEDAERDCGNCRNKGGVDQHGPRAEPERLFYHDVYAPFFEDDALVFAGNGACP